MSNEQDFTLANESHSEEVQEIISKVPAWIVRYGIYLILIIFAFFIFISWVIRYPDVINAKVVVTTDPAPINLVSQQSGRLFQSKKENSFVKKGDLIGYLQTSTSALSILKLEEHLNKISVLGVPTNTYSELGEIQDYFNKFVLSQKALHQYYRGDLLTKETIQLRKQITAYQQLGINVNSQLAILRKELNLAKDKFQTDSILFDQKVISRSDFNVFTSSYYQQQRSYRTMESAVINNDLLINELERKLEEIKVEDEKTHNGLLTANENSLNELISQILRWKEEYLFISPMDGKLAQFGFFENGQFIEQGRQLFSIIPVTEDIYAQAIVPIQGSGKVRVGQKVNIRLDNYPSEEFGMLTGDVESFSLLPTDNAYMVKISLPEGMKSTYNQQLIFQQQLKGNSEIITDDLRLIQRFLFHFRKLFSSN